MHHGNWCGPGWSNGRAVVSEAGTAPPIDEFDATCMDHDLSYAENGDLVEADYKFARQNLGTLSIQRNVAGAIVGAQAIARRAAIIMTKNSRSLRRLEPEPEPTILVAMRPTSTRRSPNPAPRKKPRTASAVPARMANAMPTQVCSAVRAAPVAYSNTVTAVTTSQGKGITTVSGREFAAGAATFASVNTQLIDGIVHHPAFYTTSALGNMCRSFREYRTNYIKVTYLGVCSTASSGWTQIVTSPDVSESAYKYTSNTDLLQRSMNSNNAILGNLWENLEHNVAVKKTWCLTQPFASDDLHEHCSGETFVFQQSQGASGVYGLCIIDYSFSFRDLAYTMHTGIPFSQYQPLTLTDSVSNPANSAVTALTNSTVTAVGNGSVWKLIALADQSTVGTGGTLANAYKIFVDATTNDAMTISNGSTFYGLVNGSVINLYPTFESAKDASSRTFVAYATTLSTATVLKVLGVRLCFGNFDYVNQS
jgi:hypothetical protein